MFPKFTKEQLDRLFITSDTHAYHKNLCTGSTEWKSGTQRDFENEFVMTDTLVENINDTVGENDVLLSLRN